MGRVAFIAFCALSAGAAIGLDALLGHPADGGAWILGLTGIAAGAVGAVTRLYPRGKVQTLVALPVFASILEAPAPVLTGIWLILLGGLSLTELGDAVPVWAPTCSALVGAALLPVFRPRRNAGYERVVARTTDSVSRS